VPCSSLFVVIRKDDLAPGAPGHAGRAGGGATL